MTVADRNKLIRELSDLKSKPRRNIEEEKRIEELKIEVSRVMQEIGRHNS